eukprot:5812814-Alexandrium_andersonii.AAC.1
MAAPRHPAASAGLSMASRRPPPPAFFGSPQRQARRGSRPPEPRARTQGAWLGFHFQRRAAMRAGSGM